MVDCKLIPTSCSSSFLPVPGTLDQVIDAVDGESGDNIFAFESSKPTHATNWPLSRESPEIAELPVIFACYFQFTERFTT